MPILYEDLHLSLKHRSEDHS